MILAEKLYMCPTDIPDPDVEPIKPKEKEDEEKEGED